MKKNIEITPNIETLFGTRDENLRLLEDGLNVAINLRADSIEISGAATDVSRAEQVFIDYEHLLRPSHVARRSLNLDGIGPQGDGDIQAIFQQAQVFVSGAKQGFDIRGYFNILLHLGSEDCLQGRSIASACTLRKPRQDRAEKRLAARSVPKPETATIAR